MRMLLQERGELRPDDGRTTQLILAFGKFLRRAESAGKASTISPSELGLMIRMFSMSVGITNSF